MEKVALIFLFFLASCSNTPVQQLKPETFYKRDMIIKHAGKTYEGAAVLPAGSKYELEIESRGKLDMFTLTTCHRDWSKERAWKTETKRFLFWKRKIEKEKQVDFSYIPTELEKGYCPMELGAYEIQRGRHSWAFLDFANGPEKVPGVLECNGITKNYKGVSLCQSRAGLYQRITFNEEMVLDPDPDCDFGGREGKRFTFRLKKGRCVYVFKVKGQKRFHRLTTLGFESRLMRE